MLTHKKIVKALESLSPGINWSLNGDSYEDVVWHKEDYIPPTEEEILLELERIDTLEQETAYQKQREKQYPKLADQLDMLWHAIDSGTLDKNSDFYLQLKEVKDKYPKG